MPYPTNVMRFNVVASTPGEEIVNTVWMRLDDGVIYERGRTLQAVCDHVRNQWIRVITSQAGDPAGIANVFANTTSWSRVSGYKVDALGRAEEQAESTFSPALTGGAIGSLPPQLAIVTTLLTNSPGRSGRGRIYLGGLSARNVAENGRLTEADRTRIANAMAGFYVRLRDRTLLPDAVRPVVVSPTKGRSSRITRVAVGDVFDTQRSRRKSLKETRSLATVDS